MSVLCGRAACGVRCCRGPAGGAAESGPRVGPGGGPHPDPPPPTRTRAGPRHPGGASAPRACLTAPCIRRRRIGPSAHNCGGGEGHGSARSLPRGTLRPCGAWGPRCAAEALQRGAGRSQRPAARPAARRVPAREGAVWRKCGSEAAPGCAHPGIASAYPDTAPQSPRLVPHPELAHAPKGPRGQRQIRVTRLASPLIKESRLRANKGHPNYVPFPDSFFLAILIFHKHKVKRPSLLLFF